MPDDQSAAARPTRKQAIAIGAGIARVTAAFRLHQAGWQVRVLERQATAGGQMRTARQNDFVAEMGA